MSWKRRRSGLLARKEGNRSVFADPWKTFYQCSIEGSDLVMKEVGKVGSSVVVSDRGERLELFRWAISDIPKDCNGDKFTLIRVEDGSKESFRAKDEKEAALWLEDLRLVLESLRTGEAADHASSPQPDATPPDNEHRAGGRWSWGSKPAARSPSEGAGSPRHPAAEEGPSTFWRRPWGRGGKSADWPAQPAIDDEGWDCHVGDL